MFVRALSLLLLALSSGASAASDAAALLARARLASGCDGGVSWNQDPGGEVARLDAPEAQRQAIKIHEIAPAAAAGLQAGDRVVRIGKEPTGARTRSQWRDLLSTEAAGTAIEVGYARDGKPQTTTLVLKDLIPLKGKNG